MAKTATDTSGWTPKRQARPVSKMTFEEAVEFRLKQTGLKKKFLAYKIGLSAVEFSLLLSGKRKYPKEKAALLRELGIAGYVDARGQGA